jgi:tetratricopeptide (TPR) repeat protein
LHALAQLPDLKVPARTSSFFFKGQNVDVREIAAKLGVSKVLEGSMQYDGDTLRITVQLIDAEDGSHLWSQQYNRKKDDIFAIQDEIATSVALAMKATLAGDIGQGGNKIETIGTKSVAAYDAYLRGLQQQNIGSNMPLLLAKVSFDEALALDPDFYEARLQLLRTYFSLGIVGEITEADARANAEPLLDRLRLEKPDDIWLQIFGMRLQHLDSVGMESFVIELSDSIERMTNEPNDARLYQVMFHALRFLQRPEEALDWLNRGIEVDLLDWNLRFIRARLLERAGDLDGAEEEYAKTIELNPGNPIVHSYAANIHWARKEYGKAFSMERNAMKADPLDYEMPADIAMILYQFGLLDEGDKYLQRARTSAPDKPYIQTVGLYQLMLQDDRSQTRDMSEKMLRDGIENRFYAYSFAATVFMSVMTELGESEEALVALEELYPGISSSDIHPDNGKDWALQYHAVLALAKTQSKQEALKLLNEVVTNWDEFFDRWRNDPGAVAVVEMARGNTDLAIELAIEDLEGQIFGAALDYRLIDAYKELALEAAVAKRLAELDAEARTGGEEIRAYIVEHNLQL